MPQYDPQIFTKLAPSKRPFPTRIPRNDEFTIGWITLRQTELNISREMLDELYGKHPCARDPSDKNAYELGRIGRNKVVMAYPSPGNMEPSMETAKHVSAQMKATFSAIRIGVMVTLGSGVPSTRDDIRLGDVVVGTPDRTFCGVVGFRETERTDEGSKVEVIETPAFHDYSRLLVSAALAFGADRKLGVQSKMSSYMARAFEWNPEMREACRYPGALNDKLFASDYRHVNKDDTRCLNCDSTRLEGRQPRENTDPVVHRGTIASSDEAVTDADVRELLQMRFGVKGIQVGAAGLGSDFQTLVICGVADYADSHANGHWGCYAALTAAAYAKELLANLTTLPTGRFLC